MSAQLIIWILVPAGLSACAFALAKGGRAERYAALVILANFAVGGVGGLEFGQNAALIFRLANDGLAAMALMSITVIYASPWLGLAMLLYAGQFSLHAFYFVTGRNVADHLHAVVNNVLFSGILFCLMAGTVMSWRRRTREARGLNPSK